MIRPPPISTPFPTRRSSDLDDADPFANQIKQHVSLSGRESGRADTFRLDDFAVMTGDRKSTRLNSSHTVISYAVFCLKKKKKRLVDANQPIIVEPGSGLARN